MLENETDGYHPVFRARLDLRGPRERDRHALRPRLHRRDARLRQRPHRIDLRPDPSSADGRCAGSARRAERLPDYVAAMNAAYGAEQAREIMIDGTPHIMIFPNLFIAEIQLFVLQPLAVDETFQHVTALQFKGAPDLNRRLREQTMGSVGPGRLPARRRHRDVRAQPAGGARSTIPEWVSLAAARTANAGTRRQSHRSFDRRGAASRASGGTMPASMAA